jgi:DUF1365 family protein
VVRSALYEGTLMHVRREPVRNVFKYPVLYWLVDLDELGELSRRLRLVSWNAPNVVSFRDGDHFEDDGLPLKAKVLRVVRERGVDLASDARIQVLTQLRVFGYVFNPVSFYWCYRPDGELACMVAELNNTFGERLPEVLPGPSLTYEHEKRLHVSPFLGLDYRYRYAFSEPGEKVTARIEVHDRDGGMPLHAVLTGRRRELTNASLARALVRYPLMPARITALIHWQALRLWLKRVPFHHKPAFQPGKGSVRA